MGVAIVSTGGTIASTPDDEGNASPELSGDELVAAVPGLDSIATVETHDFSEVPSPQFTVEQMFELVTVLEDLDADDDTDGIVVTQGTDILEETAYFASLCYTGDAPIVFTGAMRNPSLASPDGPGNLVTAVTAATDERAASFGVSVAFNYRLYPAADVTKANSQNPDSFRAPEFGPVAALDEDRLVWHRDAVSAPPALDPDPDALTNDVAAITVTADMHPRVFEACRDAKAVCFAATGAGHVPPSIIPELELLAEADVPLVATTRCHEGRLARQTYGFRGSERTLRELGCYFSDRNLAKTRIATIVGRAAGGLERVFDRPQ